MSKVVPNPACVLRLTVLIVTLAHLCYAQTPQKQFLDAHNAARAAVGVGPLVWDQTVANYAQRYANSHRVDCKMVHSKGPYGENLAWSSGDMSIPGAVKMWVDEKRFYDYNSNSCIGGKTCGHYTQVVWRKSKRLGCAKVRCNTRGTFITCNYDPPGNWNGERPYSMAE
uniref:SCP domain-containing protein n=1 Tax=Kalanchoe fedtschenkoi TaxID=63787 RepID=A0A7N0T4Z7_KALFE